MQAEDNVSVGASLLAQVGPWQWSWGRTETVQALCNHHKAPHPLASQQGQNDGGRFQASPVGKASTKAARGNTAPLGGASKAKEQHQLAELCAEEFLGKGSRQTDRLNSCCRLTLGTKWILTSS